MRFDIYSNTGYEEKVDETTTVEKTTRKAMKNLSLEEMKTGVNEMLNSIPENATHFFLNVDKSYEDQLDVALKEI